MKETKVILRPALQADQASIRQLISRARLNPLGITWQRFSVAARVDGGVVGCGQIKPHRDGTQELASLSIMPEFQGRGIAAALIRELQDQARGDLWLTCRSELIEFYERFGFSEVKDPREMPLYFRRVCRLFQVFRRLAHREAYLAVMHWCQGS